MDRVYLIWWANSLPPLYPGPWPPLIQWLIDRILGHTRQVLPTIAHNTPHQPHQYRKQRKCEETDCVLWSQWQPGHWSVILWYNNTICLNWGRRGVRRGEKVWQSVGVYLQRQWAAISQSYHSRTNLEFFIFLPPSVNIRIGVLLLFLQPEMRENKIYFWLLSFRCFRQSDLPGGGHVALLQLRLQGVQLVQQLLLVSLDLKHSRVQERGQARVLRRERGATTEISSFSYNSDSLWSANNSVSIILIMLSS